MVIKRQQEPENTSGLKNDVKMIDIFQKSSLLQFFEKFQGYNENLVLEFAKKLKNDLVTLGGYTIPITIESINQFIGLPMIGEDLLQ